MTNLEKQVKESADALKKACVQLSSISQTVLPLECHELWEKRARLHEILNGTIDIFTVKKEAWKAVEDLVAEITNNNQLQDNKVNFGNNRVVFPIARHLSLLSYITVTWSIYDRLANVCGRLAGIHKVGEGSRNPKTCEDLLLKYKNNTKTEDKNTMGFSIQHTIQYAYAWPIKVSYAIRNWLVHEGCEQGGLPLFAGDQFVDRFQLHQKASDWLDKDCNYEDNGGMIITHCCLCDSVADWQRRDLIKILESYHDEIDTMFIALLKWSVVSFTEQIKAFVR